MGVVFDGYILRRLRGLGSLESKASKDEWTYKKVSLQLDFHVLHYEGNFLFVPTGTVESPRGISILNDDYIVFVNEKRGHVVHVSLLKKYIKENSKNLKRGEVDSRFGYHVPVNDIISFSLNLFDETSLDDHDS